MRRHRAQQKNTPMKREAVVAVLVSEGLALVSVSARTASSDCHLLETLHTQKQKCQEKPIFTNLKKRFKHIELPAKLLDNFLRINKSNINQSVVSYTHDMSVCWQV